MRAAAAALLAVAVVALAAAALARELDPAACAARFDVQRDKIIRTEESRDMGARYLSELDVGARAECLRLCCETDACDVFVFEEKGAGSCYLFECGPPEDFRCKFTAHSNFSSGVLALSRRLAELQDQEQRAHRERELADLRSAPPAAASTAPPPRPAAPAPPPHTSPRPSQATTAAAVAAAEGAGRCSRYQFECRRGGECIAVYNACDGVPQCADGSDEAPELECPPAADPPAASPPAPPRWPHRLAQAQPPRRYNEGGGGGGGGGSHIFSHKGGLLQEAESGAYGPFEPPAPWGRRAWPPAGAEAPGAWAGASGGYARDWERAWPVPPRADPELPVYIPPKTMPEVPVVYSSVQATLRDSAKKGPEAEREAPAPPPAAPSPRPPAPPDLREERRPDAPHHAAHDLPNLHNAVRASESTYHVQSSGQWRGAAADGEADGARAAAAERHLAALEDEHDGLSDHPPAAVLLLVLGVALTGGMGGVVGCRARAARRRRGRGKPFAHDADYLVNGMYL